MLLALAIAAVSTLHPRIYVRHDAATVGRGITVTELRARLADPAFARWRAPGNFSGAAGAMERAARYLETGDAADLASVREFLLTHTFSYARNDVGGFLAGAEMAGAFDWVYAGLDARDRAAAMANIVTTCDSSRGFLERGGPDINHNYTYMALNTVAVCGLALYGEPEPYGTRAKEYLVLARRFLEPPGMVLDTWHARQSAWAEGSHYTFHETLRNLVLLLQAYRTASDTDYFTGRDFPALAGRFLIASTRPDFTFIRTGDTSANRGQANLTVPLTVEMLAAGVDDPAEAARLRSFDDALLEHYGDRAVYPAFGWGMRMFYDPRAPRTPSYRTLPKAMRLGEGTYEQIVWRNGWNPDSTHIAIIAGDHFTDHQHFDKGQFLIYHRGGLAVDSGAYDGMYKAGSHAGEYAPRTLAHNCLLVYDPAQQFPGGYTNDGGQLVIRGKQHHHDWPTYLAHRAAEGLDAGRVLAYEAADGYDYAQVDLARAYGPKVRAYQRSFVYLPARDLLVVFDRVASPFEKRWLLHFQDEPEIRGSAVTVRRPEGGTLEVRTLLPAAAAITAVGGPGREFLNPFNGINYPPGNAATAAPSREPGAWRIEVVARDKAPEETFLHVLAMSGAPDARAVEGIPGAHLRSAEGDEVVAFPAALPAVYRIASPQAARHLLAGLPPGASVTIHINRRRRAARVGPQGLLRFDDGTKGSRTIQIRLKP